MVYKCLCLVQRDYGVTLRLLITDSSRSNPIKIVDCRVIFSVTVSVDTQFRVFTTSVVVEISFRRQTLIYYSDITRTYFLSCYTRFNYSSVLEVSLSITLMLRKSTFSARKYNNNRSSTQIDGLLHIRCDTCMLRRFSPVLLSRTSDASFVFGALHKFK